MPIRVPLDAAPPEPPPARDTGPSAPHTAGLPRVSLLELAFRPFYLLAAIAAVALLLVWVLAWHRGWALIGTWPAMAWHAHEMVFGAVVAVVTGFLLTAGRLWTGIDTPVRGRLALVAALWIAGRAAAFMPPAAGAAIDIAHLPLLAWLLGWRVVASRTWRNVGIVGVLVALAASNLAFHLAVNGVVGLPPLEPVRWALALLVLLTATIGGRVTPAFTRARLPSARVRARPWLDRLALASLAACAAALPWREVTAPGFAMLCGAAAILHLGRLAGWAPLAAARVPLLGVLHLAYAWIPVGLALHALAALGLAPTASAAWHAWALGALAGMILAMMTRTARGHTARALEAGRIEIAIYAAIHLGALARVAGPALDPARYAGWVDVATALWCAAFLAYFVRYLPWLVAPRVDGKPG